ncbi:MAG: hypothetical protein AAFV46_11325 [Cyanobacteria bacterium J06635_11]
MFIWPALSGAASAQFARLYEVDGGAVYLRRSNWKNFYQTYPRTMLLGDDLLNVEVGADVVLLCPDGYLSDSIQVGVSNVGATCVGTPRSVRPTFGISSEWHATDATEPYVITPWSEQVLTATPMFRWNPVAIAQESEIAQAYEVTLQRRDGESWETVWTVTSEQASMAYPAGEPELEAGEEYALRVAVVGEGGEENSDAVAEEVALTEDAIATKVFSLLDGFDQQGLAEEVAKVEAFDVDELTKTLILVEEIYPRYKLFAQGTEDLTALIEAGTENELIHRLLGDYYIRSGLALPAEASYLKAIELAQAGENIEEEALASWGLGTLYARSDQMQQACTYLQKSQKLADELGDTDLMASIEAEMERLAVNNE